MDSLGITAVIATILSMIFAAAALWNSVVRRRHEAEMAKRLEPEKEKIKFKPAPASPLVSSHPHASVHSSVHATSRNSDPSPQKSTPPQLFRQVRPSGEVEDEVFQEDEDMYVWE